MTLLLFEVTLALLQELLVLLSAAQFAGLEVALLVFGFVETLAEVGQTFIGLFQGDTGLF